MYQFLYTCCRLSFGAGAALLLVLTVAAAQVSRELPALSVVGQTGADLEERELQETLERVPGGTNLINLEDFRGSQMSVARVLNSEPGIIVQEFFGGNDQPRVNIRGSGIQDNPVSRGIQLLYDGLPLNQADGSFIIGLLDPEQARFISVYRGANAMRYGATTLGGAIDFGLRTARNTPESSLRLEAGSFGLRRTGLVLSQLQDDWDIYLQTAVTSADGWRDHSEAQRSSLALNIGWRSDVLENRTYLNWAENAFDIPFLLSKSRALSHPRSVLGDQNTNFDLFMNIRNREPHRDTQQLRLANKTIWHGYSTTHSLGIYGEKIDDEFKNPVVQANTEATNIGLDWGSEYRHDHGTWRTSELMVFASANRGSMPRDHFSVAPTDGRLLERFASVDQDAANLVLGGQLLTDLAPSWRGLVALQYARNTRDISDRLNPGVLDSDFRYQAFNPKAGLIFIPDDFRRYYANISRSSEAPTFWQLAVSAPNPNAPLNSYLEIADLKMQTATTLEIGTQQRGARFGWEASWYYSEVKNELIAEVRDFAIDGTTVNYNHPTIHQGVELGFNARTPSGLWRADDHLSFRAIYNWSDFRFDGGRYDGKRVAGIPEHLLFGEAGYWFHPALFISLNVRHQPSDTFVDHSNAGLKQDAYTLWGAKLTWSPRPWLDLFVDAQNITGETYQTAYVIRGFSPDDPNVPTFIPGPDFHLSAGMTARW